MGTLRGQTNKRALENAANKTVKGTAKPAAESQETDAAAIAASAAEFFRRRAEREVFVRPLPYEATETTVLEALGKGHAWLRPAVERVKIVRMESADAKVAAFVTLRTTEDAKRCLAELNGVKMGVETLSVSFTRGGGKGKQETCMFFLEGKCSRGSSCKFLHPSEGAERTAPPSGRRLPTCKFFAEGRCSRGDACKFSHALTEEDFGGTEGKQEEADKGKLDLVFDPSVSLPSLFEDEEVLAVNKPAGVLSHPSPGFWDGGTVAHALVGRVADAMLRPRVDHKEENSYIPRAVVHRLDQGTTGVMVLAKTPRAELQLAGTLRVKDSTAGEKLAAKTYVALLLGKPKGSGRPRSIDVNASLGRDPWDPRRMAVQPEGRVARSRVHVHCHNGEHCVTLVTVEIFTGRMHQIRVHCAHLGAPVAGDALYGDSEADSTFRDALGLVGFTQRPLLHAWALDLPHPSEGEGKAPLRLRAPLPQDMRRVIADLWPDLSPDPAQWPSSSSTNGAAGKEHPSGKSAKEEGAELSITRRRKRRREKAMEQQPQERMGEEEREDDDKDEEDEKEKGIEKGKRKTKRGKARMGTGPAAQEEEDTGTPAPPAEAEAGAVKVKRRRTQGNLKAKEP